MLFKVIVAGETATTKMDSEWSQLLPLSFWIRWAKKKQSIPHESDDTHLKQYVPNSPTSDEGYNSIL